MNISIFAKRAFRGHDGHLMRVSSIIRADQIAEEIKAKLNPKADYKKDVCIYVKPHVPAEYDFSFEGKIAYLDIIDGWKLLPMVSRHPKVGVITCSQADTEYVSGQISNKVIFIPQHHCNFERAKRARDQITTVGCIGTSGAFPWLPEGLKKELSKREMKLIEFSEFYTRQDIVNFYKKIDIQIVWRPYMRKMKIRMSNPLKLVNAASFGIPTIAYDEPAFREVQSCYIPVHTLEEFLTEIDSLIKNPSQYTNYSKTCLEKSEKYHIENIAKLYRKLK